MNTILKKLQEKSDYNVEEYWALRYFESTRSYFGFNLSNTYKGNFEAAFLQIRNKMLKTNYIDILKDQIEICEGDEDKTLTIEEKIKENFTGNDTLWMEIIKKEKPAKIREQPFEAFCKKERKNVMEKNPEADHDTIMDILIKKWDQDCH